MLQCFMKPLFPDDMSEVSPCVESALSLHTTVLLPTQLSEAEPPAAAQKILTHNSRYADPVFGICKAGVSGDIHCSSYQRKGVTG